MHSQFANRTTKNTQCALPNSNIDMTLTNSHHNRAAVQAQYDGKHLAAKVSREENPKTPLPKHARKLQRRLEPLQIPFRAKGPLTSLASTFPTRVHLT